MFNVTIVVFSLWGMRESYRYKAVDTAGWRYGRGVLKQVRLRFAGEYFTLNFRLRRVVPNRPNSAQAT